jgi:hypothetical protein
MDSFNDAQKQNPSNNFLFLRTAEGRTKIYRSRKKILGEKVGTQNS